MEWTRQADRPDWDGVSPGQNPRDTPAFAALAHHVGPESPHENDLHLSIVVPTSPLGDALVAAFPHHSPPLTNRLKVDASSGLAVDAATGHPVTVWDAHLIERHGDRAAVSVTWYSGNLGAGEYRVELRRVGGRWEFTGEKLGWIS